MYAVASDKPRISKGNMLLRHGYLENCPGTHLPNGTGARTVSSQAMLRPFHSLENQCAEERRLKAERCRDASSRAGFSGQMRNLTVVQQRLQSMRENAPVERASPEACLEVGGECRWSMLPGSAPASLRRPGVRGGAKGARRRRPVHVISEHHFPSIGEAEDPALMPFDEEPEDPRVYLPAHRIGDILPEAAMGSPPKKPQPQTQLQPARSPPKVILKGNGVSKSMPCLHIAASRLCLGHNHGGSANVGNSGHFNPSAPQEQYRGSSGILDDPVFPEPPHNCGGAGGIDDDDDSPQYLPD